MTFTDQNRTGQGPQDNSGAQQQPRHDTREAERFLKLLDPNATGFTFQTFDDVILPDGTKRGDFSLTCVRHGSLAQHRDELVKLNQQGAGIFVTINATDLKGRKTENVVRTRAVWGEFDNGAPETLPLLPSIVVSTSPGKGHVYWLCNGLMPEQHLGCEERLIESYGSDKGAKDLVRVLRLPGFLHMKREPFLVTIQLAEGTVYTSSQIVKAFPPIERVAAGTEDDEHHEPIDRARVLAALKRINPDDRDVWRNVGAALKHELGKLGFPYWDEWAQKSEKYDAADQRKTWNSLKRTRADGKLVTIGTVYHLARQGGWDGKADAADGGEGEGKDKRKSQVDQLIAFAAQAELFHTANDRRYADVTVGNHRQTLPIEGYWFAEWLRGMYFDKTGSVPSADALKNAIATMAMMAKRGPERSVCLRVGAHDGKLYIDLCDKAWRAVEIDLEGWRIVDRPPVRFVRHPGQLPLPEPVRGGSIDELRPFVLTDDDGFVMIVSWQLGALRGGASQYAGLAYSGPPGGGKTTRARFVRQLVDPNEADTQAPPAKLEDLLVIAASEHVVALDNLSYINGDLSDAMSRLATGGGNKKRKYYTDDTPHTFVGVRPQIVASMADVITKADLADRFLFVIFDRIPAHQRIDDDDLKEQFNKAAPRIFGALLDGMAHGLRNMGVFKYAEMGPKALPRMAGFAKWVMACETAYWPRGTFEQAYAANQSGTMDMLLETEPVVGALSTLLNACSNAWKGSATDLLAQINIGAGGARQAKGWPRTAQHLSARLNERAEALKTIGIMITKDRNRDPAGRPVGPWVLHIARRDVAA